MNNWQYSGSNNFKNTCGNHLTSKLGIQCEKYDNGLPASECVQFTDSKILGKNFLMSKVAYCGYQQKYLKWTKLH